MSLVGAGGENDPGPAQSGPG